LQYKSLHRGCKSSVQQHQPKLKLTHFSDHQNILLEELENFKGIFLATTNLADNLDKAFDRRFLFKIKFERPELKARTAIWMDKISYLSKEDATYLADNFDLTGGQIDNIVRKM